MNKQTRTLSAYDAVVDGPHTTGVKAWTLTRRLNRTHRSTRKQQPRHPTAPSDYTLNVGRRWH